LGVRFDIAKVEEVESLFYGRHCWEVLFRAVPLPELGGAELFEGDTGATLRGEEYVYALVLQCPDQGLLASVKSRLEESAEFRSVAAEPRFVEGRALDGEPLPDAGRVDASGRLVVPEGRVFNADVAWDAVCKAKAPGPPAAAKAPPAAPARKGALGAIRSWLAGSREKRLVKAARAGDVERVRGLLAEGADANVKVGGSRTALGVAAEQGHLAVVQALLAAGADPNARGPMAMTPLMEAARVNHAEVMRALLAAGADVLVSLTQIPGSCDSALHFAAIANAREAARLLVEAGAEVDARDEMQNTPLMLATEAGQFGCAAFFIGAGADLNATNSYQDTALGMAAREGFEPLVALLLEAGADPRAAACTDPLSGRVIPAAQMAEEAGHEQIAARIRAAAPKT
jgi:ankyrin repeat protein